MKTKIEIDKRLLRAILSVSVFACPIATVEFVHADTRPASSQDADNSARNVRDQSGETKTPADQSNLQANIDTTAAIRKAIINTEKLSTYADNIKIITSDDGTVTLRGPVRTGAEADKIISLARQVAPNSKIVNKLEIAS